MIKDQVRAIGIDDAPFEFSQEDVLVVGTVVRAPNYLEGVLSTRIGIDGNDATRKIKEMVNGSKFKGQAKVIFVDGAALGGFNLVDLEELNQQTGIPCISVSRKKPDFQNIKKAMKKHFELWEEKFEQIKKGDIYKMETKDNPIYIQKEGANLKTVKRLLDIFTLRGRLPEPIRISHIIAAGVVKGESRGKA
ncbi:MAG: DUF99 family protein [Candidatus Aenigmatarchaeota archaeon]